MAQDVYGTVYQNTYGPSNLAPTAGTPVTIRNGDGTTSQGTWMGYAAKN